jgi:hypothetical protein
MKFSSIVALFSTSKAVCDFDINSYGSSYSGNFDGYYSKVNADGTMRRIGFNGDSYISITFNMI